MAADVAAAHCFGAFRVGDIRSEYQNVSGGHGAAPMLFAQTSAIRGLGRSYERSASGRTFLLEGRGHMAAVFLDHPSVRSGHARPGVPSVPQQGGPAAGVYNGEPVLRAVLLSERIYAFLLLRHTRGFERFAESCFSSPEPALPRRTDAPFHGFKEKSRAFSIKLR